MVSRDTSSSKGQAISAERNAFSSYRGGLRSARDQVDDVGIRMSGAGSVRVVACRPDQTLEHVAKVMSMRPSRGNAFDFLKIA